MGVRKEGLRDSDTKNMTTLVGVASQQNSPKDIDFMKPAVERHGGTRERAHHVWLYGISLRSIPFAAQEKLST